jgi:ribulose-5-phosphate 4-epimerase/fuculose-1-phosphate aldolase
MSILSGHRDLANQLCQYSRLCYERRLVGAAGGNLSARLPDGKGFITTASGVSLRDVEEANLVVIDINGKTLESPDGLRASKEVGFHLAIYRQRPEAKVIIHVHPTCATVYSMMGRTIPLTTVSAKLKLKQGLIVAEADPGSLQLVRNVEAALRGSPRETSVLLMECHGLIAFHSSLADAFDIAELAEDTAKIALLAEQQAAAPRKY